MNGQPLPGFYYDPDKNKYFRIQSAAASRDLAHSLPYSAQNLRKKERADKLQQAAAAHRAKTHAQRVVRRHVTTLAQTCVEREFGLQRRSFCTQRLWPGACMAGVVVQPDCALEKPPETSIRRFDRDPRTKTVYAVHGDNTIKRRHYYCHGELPGLAPHSDERGALLSRYALNPWDTLGRTTSTVSSLCFLPATAALAVTTYGSDRPPVVQLSDPDTDGPYVSQQFTPKDCSAIRASAARPTTFDPSPGLLTSVAASHVEHLAVAASSSLLLFTRSQTGAWDSHVVANSEDSDIYSLDWLSYTTVALGLRSGKIILYDTRSGGTSHVLTHPTPVFILKRADDQTRIVCSGLNDSLYLYDIRYDQSAQLRRRPGQPKSETHYNDQYFAALPSGKPRRGKKRRKLDHVAAQRWSEPVHAFPHNNLDDAELAVDVHPRLGLVAAAQDSETDVAIRVSNLWTGKAVKEYTRNVDDGGRLEHGKKDVETIRSLQFVDEEQGSNGVEIWAGWKGGIAKFGW